ncbi:MAG: acetate--CoA ligase family protein, partial [Thermoanaerobaculia bacterium]
VSGPDEIGEELLAKLPGDKVVLKGIAVELPHKSEVGGVRVVPKNCQQVAAAADAMTRSMSGLDLRGILIQEFVAYEAEPGSEALLSLRWDREFGAVVTFGIGGIHAEKLTAALREEAALAIFAPELRDRAQIGQEISGLLVTELMTQVQRGRPARIAMEHVGEVVGRFAAAAPLLTSGLLDEIEINPLVARSGRLVALDVLAKLSVDRPQPMPARPLDKLDRLLRPSSIALIGVAERLNAGRLILRNLLRGGFDPENVVVVKPGRESIDGCKCYGDIASLPQCVDLLIVSVAAEQVPAVVQETVEYRRAETLILIPGGLEEKTGSEHISDAIRRSLAVGRASEWRGPLVNGGNCLGVRSQPGRYDTFFLQDHKLPSLGQDEGNVALLAQSGAFLASKMSKLQQLRVRYAISIGNQIDLTLGDYLSYLLDDDRVDLFGVYVEGFRDLDGRKFLAAARRITGSGRRIVLYRAGRSRSGVAAAASHTAAMAGSYRVTRALARTAGAQVVDTLQDFEDLLLLNSRFEGR